MLLDVGRGLSREPYKQTMTENLDDMLSALGAIRVF